MLVQLLTCDVVIQVFYTSTCKLEMSTSLGTMVRWTVQYFQGSPQVDSEQQVSAERRKERKRFLK